MSTVPIPMDGAMSSSSSAWLAHGTTRSTAARLLEALRATLRMLAAISRTAGEGVYYVTMDLAAGTLNGVKINNMNLVGDFNGWNQADDAQQMKWNATDYCYEITGAGVTSNGWKFPANNSWDINLGGTVDKLWGGGDNLTVVGSTIKLYPTRRDSDNIYCKVE